MTTTNRRTPTRPGLCGWAATAAVVLLGLLMLISPPAGAQTADGPTDAFCQAWADYKDAQDGAELNTALGEMQAALTAGAPAEVAEALVTLGQGDLDPAVVQAASDVVAEWADEPCAATTSTTTDSTPSTATSTSNGSTTSTTAATTTSLPPGATTSLPDDDDSGQTPTGGIDTGAGGAAGDSGPIGPGLVVTLILIAAGVGATTIAGRRWVADCR